MDKTVAWLAGYNDARNQIEDSQDGHPPINGWWGWLVEGVGVDGALSIIGCHGMDEWCDDVRFAIGEYISGAEKATEEFLDMIECRERLSKVLSAILEQGGTDGALAYIDSLPVGELTECRLEDKPAAVILFELCDVRA